VLMQKYRGDTPGKERDRIVAFDLRSRKEQELLYDDEHAVYHPFFSPDDHWVVFKRQLTMTKSQLMIAPYRSGRALPVSDWIEITDGKFSDDKPQFSSDGNRLYFTSDRDGYVCIWSQRLTPVTKRPLGDPLGYEHFHNAMGRDAASYPQIQWMSDLTVGADRILINLQQRRRDIWAVQVK
jgi:eukaryotic-like serine/threonine-protein kinase